MTYTEFESALLAAIGRAEATASRGQVAVLPIAEAVLPGVNEQWPWDAVESYELHGWLNHVSRLISPPGITVTLSAEGRKAVESQAAP